MVALALAPAEIKLLRDQFKALDTDGSGTLSLKEFREAMMKNASMDRQSITELFAKVCELQNVPVLSYCVTTPA